MKTLIQILAVVIVLTTTSCIASYPPSHTTAQQPNGYESNPPAQQPTTSYQSNIQQPQVSLQVFYDQLSPYGIWVSYGNYGYVWIPNAGPNFQPYATEGHWVFTDIGWTWYSNYSWGWAPFHYGRWFLDNQYGWVWVPDTEWGPAWVAWRSGGDYYGWAPLEPGISINIVIGGSYHVPQDRWVFVRNRDIDRSNVYSYTVNRTSNTTIINNTTIVQNTRSNTHNNTTYITGPDRNDVQRVTGRPVKQVAIRENRSPGQNLNKTELKIYKPQVQRDDNSGRRSAPAKVQNLDNVKPMAERYQGRQQRKQNPRTQPVQNKGKQNKSDKKKGNDKKDGGNN
jgi:hypothetical protein